jgi:hypothetical protein
VPSFAAWETFYVIVGSSAAALTGLQFVVIVLGAETNLAIAGPTKRAFATPTVVHFCATLLIAAILTAPWQTVLNPAICLAASAIAGIAYVALVLRNAKRQKDYVPVLEDWLWHVVLPALAYLAVFASAITLPLRTVSCLFAIGAASLFLLFIGIHNAWDAVTYIALSRK